MVDTSYNNSCRRYSCDQISHSNHRNNPSFSSTLLDSIYRSIDLGENQEMRIYKDVPVTKNCDHRMFSNTDEEIANIRRACMIEKWMEKKATQNAVVAKSRNDRADKVSVSRDVGYEHEPVPVHKPKPIRTGVPVQNHRGSENDRRGGYGDQLDLKPIKSRALKIYGDLKKIKQPISPGGKVAAFLNSIFTAGNLKKPKTGAVRSYDSPSLKSTTDTTPCSSASSFSRSCLSKTPSSRGKSEKRTVRFFTNEKSSLRRENDDRIKSAINEEIMVHVMENNRKKNCEFEEDDDDADSYASSDLFELDNLSAIGMDRYREELPVYETTDLRTNRAIANCFYM